jgi:hypothetical protein
MLTKVTLHSTPKILNIIELTMKLWEDDAKMTQSFNNLLHKRPLRLEVWLQLEDAPGTTGVPIFRACLAFHLQFVFP